MGKTKIRAADVRDDFPEEKRQNDRQSHLWAHLAIRPLSFYITPFFVNRGISANVVTGVGLIVLLSAFAALLATPWNAGLLVVGAVLINIWYLLDFVDGNVARYSNLDSTFGAFFDWYVGVIYHVGVPLCVGIAVYLSEAFTILPVDPVWWLVLAVVMVLARLLRRLTAQKVSLLSDGSGNGGELSTIEMVAGAATSFKAPVLLVCALIGAVDIWLLLYGMYNLAAAPIQLLLNMNRLRA